MFYNQNPLITPMTRFDRDLNVYHDHLAYREPVWYPYERIIDPPMLNESRSRFFVN